jgi:hypothetical protein
MPTKEDMFWQEYRKISEQIAQKRRLFEETLEKGRVTPLTLEEIHKANEAIEEVHKLEKDRLELVRTRPPAEAHTL